jgi:hypothetical protein
MAPEQAPYSPEDDVAMASDGYRESDPASKKRLGKLSANAGGRPTHEPVGPVGPSSSKTRKEAAERLLKEEESK